MCFKLSFFSFHVLRVCPVPAVITIVSSFVQFSLPFWFKSLFQDLQFFLSAHLPPSSFRVICYIFQELKLFVIFLCPESSVFWMLSPSTGVRTFQVRRCIAFRCSVFEDIFISAWGKMNYIDGLCKLDLC